MKYVLLAIIIITTISLVSPVFVDTEQPDDTRTYPGISEDTEQPDDTRTYPGISEDTEQPDDTRTYLGISEDTEQPDDTRTYLGISEDMIKSFFGEDGINTEAEHANAVLVNDLYLIDAFYTEANVSNDQRKVFWLDEYYWPVLPVPINSTTIGLSYFPVENSEQLLDKVNVLYLGSNFITTAIEFN